MVSSMTADALASLLVDDSQPLQLMDVREWHEVEIVAIPQFWVMPLSESNGWVDRVLDQFDRDCKTIVLCHHGVRSMHVCQWLMSQGFTDVANVVGGIDAYARQVDPSLPRY